jgi:hypothetical protein
MDGNANGRRAAGVPFQKDQLVKIFEILGIPNRKEPPPLPRLGKHQQLTCPELGNRWPTINQLPEYGQLAKFPR